MAPPRVLCVPSATGSDGADAVWLADSYGLTPDAWQADVLGGWLATRDRRWAATLCGLAVPRQNGKNGCLEVRELYGTVALAERILHTAHEVKTARKAFARLLEFFDNPRQYPELAGMVREIRRTNGQEAIVLDNGGSVEFIARSRGSGRGFSVDVLVLDEVQELSEDSLAALLPTISASDNPQTIMLGTPPGLRSCGEVFTRVRSAGVAGSDPRLDWREWSCADDLTAVDLSDEAEWATRNPAMGLRLRRSTIADERSVMDAETFARERLGWWKPGGSVATAIDVDQWAALADHVTEIDPGELVFAVATDPDHEWVAIAVAWRRADGRAQVFLTDYARSTAWVRDRVKELRERWQGRFLVDLAARGLVEDAEEPSSEGQAQADNALADAIIAGTLRQSTVQGLQGAMTTAVKGSMWRPRGESRVLDRRGSVEISPVRAVSLALYGLNVEPDYDVLTSVY